jgi:pilus assembly protein CpaC
MKFALRRNVARLGFGAAIVAALACSLFAAQAPVASPAPPQQTVASAGEGQFPKVELTAGRSTVLTTAFDVTRIAVTSPDVADATVVQPREILIDGKKPGTVSLIIWGPATRVQYDIVVDLPITTLEQQLHILFPGEDITVSTSEGALILSGHVSSTKVMLRAAEIAAASMPKMQLINMLQVPGGNQSEQVMLQVRFGEVNRSMLSEAGLNLFVARQNFLARSTTQQFAAPSFDTTQDNNVVTFSDFLNLFFFQRNQGIGGVLRALQQTGAFQSLAEPNLIAYNGQEASFLAGGEFPVPVVSGAAGTVSVTFKEFGIRLTFTPTIAGDVLRLKVKPEVSSLDFTNGVTISGFRIPALTTRRAETVVELRDGQSFAIAGLLDNVAQNNSAAIPIMSQLPIIGPLFKSRSKNAQQTELMVLVTPRLVRALDPDEVPPLPTNPDMFIKKPGEDLNAKPGETKKPGGGEETRGAGEPKAGGDIGNQLAGPAGFVDAPPPAANKRKGRIE